MRGGPTLYRLAAEREYNRIASNLDNKYNDIDDIFWCDHYGCNVLHLLCQAQQINIPLLQAIEKILHYAPAYIVSIPDSKSLTPLHYAVEKRLILSSSSSNNNMNHTQLVLMMIKCYPDSVSLRTQQYASGMKYSYKATPFHIACEANSDIQILREMLRANPKLVLGNDFNENDNNNSSNNNNNDYKKNIYSISHNPLQLLWKNYCSNNGHHHPFYSYNNNNNNSIEEKMFMLLLTAYYDRVTPTQHQRHHELTVTVQDEEDENKKYDCLVHAACFVGVHHCPKDLIAMIISKFSKQLILRDKKKNFTPLHYVIQNASMHSQTYTQYIIQCIIQFYPKAAAQPFQYNKGEDEFYSSANTLTSCIALSTTSNNNYLATSLPSPKIISNDTSNASQCHYHHRESNRLPLHVAILDAQMTWNKGGIEELVLSYPDALKIPDPHCIFFPFLASAVHSNKSRLHLTTTYKLLLECPEVLQQMLDTAAPPPPKKTHQQQNRIELTNSGDKEGDTTRRNRNACDGGDDDSLELGVLMVSESMSHF